MNGRKVVIYDAHELPNITKVVTHADYRALEEINRQLVRKSNTLTILTARLEEELSALRVRMIDADRYQWLRDESNPNVCAFYLSVGMALHGVRFTPETVDQFIDHARTKNNTEDQDG